MQLSSLQLKKFFRDGYLLIPNLFHANEVKKISNCLERIYQEAQKNKRTRYYKGTQLVFSRKNLHRAVWCAAAEPWLLKIGEDPRITTPVSQILHSTTLQQLICQAHFKMPGDTIGFDWHQDSQNRRYGTRHWKDVNKMGSYVQTLMAIDPMTKTNGPLEVIPGSHHLGHLGLDKAKNPTKLFNVKEAKHITMKPGSLLIFGPYLIHGSAPNNSTQPRRVFINGYAHPQANKRVYPGKGSGRIVKSNS